VCIEEINPKRAGNYSSDIAILTNEAIVFFDPCIHTCVFICILGDDPKRAYLFLGIRTFACVLLCMVNDPKRAGVIRVI
jgi:hypothetical protein